MPASGLAIIPLIVYIGGFVTCLVIEKLNRRMGRKVSYFFIYWSWIQINSYTF